VSFACHAETGKITRTDEMPLPSPNYVYCMPR
jgi:hypothetical protein